MTRNYSRLWNRPHRPHRDSPYPNVPQEPVHLYTYQSDFYPEEFVPNQTSLDMNPTQNVLLEDLDLYYPETPDQNEIPSNPMFDHGVTSEYDSCDDYDPSGDHQYRVTPADVDSLYDEIELSAEENGPEPSDLNDSFDHGNNHDFDPNLNPSLNPNWDMNNDQSEPNYEEDILNHEFNRLDLEPNSQDLEDYPNYGHGVVYPPVHSHWANKAFFFHHDLNQDFHVDCMICEQYIEEIYKDNAADYNYDHENDYNSDHGPSYNFDHAPDYDYDHGDNYNYDHGPSYNFDHGTHHDP